MSVERADRGDHLGGVGETPGPVLRVHQPSVDGDIEHSARTLDQLRTGAELALQHVRQTGGSREVVSNDAVLDRDLHDPSLSVNTAFACGILARRPVDRPATMPTAQRFGAELRRSCGE